MGSSASKAASKGGRRFPTRAPGAAPPAPTKPARRPPHAPAFDSPPITADANRDRQAAAADATSSTQPPAEDDSPPSSAFAARLRQMGVADPRPTFSPSSTAQSQPQQAPRPGPAATSHMPARPPPPPPSAGRSPVFPSQTGGEAAGVAASPTLVALQARKRMQAEVEAEFAGGTGRTYVDAGTIRRALLLRDRGVDAGEIEKRLNLGSGVVDSLGAKGMVQPVSGGAD